MKRNETEADVKGEKIAVPPMLRGDAGMIAAALTEQAAQMDRWAMNYGAEQAHKKKIARLRLLSAIFAALGDGDGDTAASAYNAISEGF